MRTKIKTIDVNAKEWFDKTWGNSYFSANVTVNFNMKNEIRFEIPMEYGSNDHYKYVAFAKICEKFGIVTDKVFWRYCEENKITWRSNLQENCKKRDLIK